MTTSSANFGSVRGLGGSPEVLLKGELAFPVIATVVTPTVLSWTTSKTGTSNGGWTPASGVGVPGLVSATLTSAGVITLSLAQPFIALDFASLTFGTASSTNVAPACTSWALSQYNTNVTGQVGNFSPGLGTAPPAVLNATCPAKQIQILLYAPGGTTLTTPGATDTILFVFGFRSTNAV